MAGGAKSAITTIYLVRHAHADWRDDEARQLSESGRATSQLVADLLSALPITTIYSSPLRRSIETVAPLAGRLGIGLELIRDLRERELPVVPPGEFNRAVEETWHPPESAVAGGESNLDARSRGLAAVRGILKAGAGKHTAWLEKESFMSIHDCQAALQHQLKNDHIQISPVLPANLSHDTHL